MNTETYIDKFKKIKESEDYAFLRKKGIEHIQQLTKSLWTDHNIHDPGITILEILCYAVTELGYRTNYAIEDILAEETLGQEQSDNADFFSARQVLPCNPVTKNDFRKIIIDVPGVKNGWIEIVEKPDPQIYINCAESKLTMSENADYESLNIQGLYNVILEFEEDSKIGDLNRYYFTQSAGNNAFTFDIILPPWDVYFNDAVEFDKITKIEFSTLTSVAKSKKYIATLDIETEGGKTFSYPVTVISREEKTESNKTLIQDELGKSDGVLSLYRAIVKRSLEIANDVYCMLHSHRNLCEDFYRFYAAEIEEIALCSDLEVSPDADINEVLAQVYYKLIHFMNPSVRFYSIKEMMEKGKKIEEIFEGPSLDHGFIDDMELEKSELAHAVYVSDIIQILMDIEGVVAVKSIMLTNFYNSEPVTDGSKWCLKIGKNRRIKFSIDRSKVVLYKGLLPYYADKTVVEEKIDGLFALDRYARLGWDAYDLEIPQGVSWNIQNYSSIQNDFPFVYGIGKEGLPKSAAKLRKAQAKQLKAYLMFFDKLLADYFCQLAHVKELFSINSSTKKTYFTQTLYPVPDISHADVPQCENLNKEFVNTLDIENHPEIDIDDISTYKAQWQTYVDNLKNSYIDTIDEVDKLVETTSTYEDRKNRFLDHLMARFNEQFTDYVLLLFTLNKKRAPADLIEDKKAFLSDYPKISYERGKAFNYKDMDELWLTENVSGLQKRVSRLLGINTYLRRFLAHCIEGAFEIYNEKDKDGVDEFRFRLKDKKGMTLLLSSSGKYYSKEAAYIDMQRIAKLGIDENNYDKKIAKDGRFYFNIINQDGEIIARRIEYFSTEAERDDEIKNVIKFLETHADCEGFHLIEHILLRPKTETDLPLSVCVEKNCEACSGFVDPYSFRITIVVPSWPERFQNMDFRRFFESTVRMEAPAHVHVKICWVTQEQMNDFENDYFAWLNEIAKEKPVQEALSIAQNKLIETLESLRSVYPETRLYDCKKGGQVSPILLNHTTLGSFKSDENGDL